MTNMAWHFTNGKLRDGQDVPADGKWLHFEGKPRMCECGLHASRRVIDALQYAPGQTVHRVVVKDIADENKNDKLVASSRLILWRHELPDDLLRQFARECALSVIDLWDAPAVVREYLETGDEKLRAAARDAARGAARDAAWDAARGAAWAAARDAAWDAARGAAWAAARDAARDAARGAARDAAWDAARGAAWAAARDAAWDAARGAAWAAARDAARDAARGAKLDEFNTLLEAKIREAAKSPNDEELLKGISP